jgi:hypothetical protein
LRRAGASSSATTTRRKAQRHSRSAVRRARDRETAAAVVERAQPRLDVRDPVPAPHAAAAQPDAVVGDRDDGLVPFARDVDGDRERLALARHPVPDRVLEQRLQHQERHDRVARGRLDAHVEAQSLLEPRPHHVDVHPLDVELVAERHLLRLARQHGAQELAQPRQHRVGAPHVLVHHRRDRVQRVEEKVRVELEPQVLQRRLRELRAQLGRRKLRLAHPLLTPDEVHERADDRVGDDVVRRFHRIAPQHVAVVVRAQPRQRRDGRARQRHQRRVQDRVDHRTAGVRERRARPAGTRPRDTPRDAEHDRHDDERGRDAGQLLQQPLGRRAAAMPRQIVEVPVQERRQPDEDEQRDEPDDELEAPSLHRCARHTIIATVRSSSV